MTPRRQETVLPPYPSHKQPVRFYKIVALTFLVLTIVLLATVIFMSTKRAVITITTKTTPVDVNTTIDIGSVGSDNTLEGTVTTTVVSLSKLFQPTGEGSELGFAEGVVTLINDSNIAQPLVVKTRLWTPDEVQFRLTEGVTVPAKGSIDVLVRADEEGATGDVASSTFIIPGLNADKQKEIYAKTKEPFAGGVRVIGILSDIDLKTAEKIMKEEIEELGKERLQGKIAGEQTGSVYSVIATEVSADKEVGEEVSGYTLFATSTVLGVFYNEDALQTWSNKKLSTRAAEDSEIVEPSKDMPKITFEEYNKESGVAKVNIFSTGNAVLNPESDKIKKQVFFGMTRDEVRRYLLTLDHVNGVDIELKPAWVTRIPSVTDHVRVIVENK